MQKRWFNKYFYLDKKVNKIIKSNKLKINDRAIFFELMLWGNNEKKRIGRNERYIAWILLGRGMWNIWY